MEEETINKPKFNLKEYINKNKKKFFGIILFLILIVFAIIIFFELKKKQNIEISKNYNTAKILIEKKNKSEALKILEQIIKSDNSFYSPSALNLIIDNDLIKDKTKILSYYEQIISRSNLDFETKNLFIFKKIIFIGEDINEIELLSNLNPILKSDSLWKDAAANYIKKYYLSKGEFKKAKEFEIITRK